jgi:hypothetical protein
MRKNEIIILQKAFSDLTALSLIQYFFFKLTGMGADS